VPFPDLARAFQTLFFGCAMFPLFLLGERGAPPSPRRVRLRRDISRLRRAYEDIAQGSSETLARDLRMFRASLDETRRALLLLIDCLETLVQDAERRFGSQPGQGAYKARQVKAALTYLLLNSKIDLPNVPSYVEPFLFEAFADWAIDALVLLINRDGIWVGGARARRAKAGWLTRLLRAVFVQPFAGLRTWLTDVARRWVLARATMSPSVQAMVQEVVKQGAFDPGKLAREGLSALEWLSANRRKVLALIQVISIGTKEAEGFLETSGPEKKAYVRDLVMAWLDETGALDGLGALDWFVEWFVDFGIDAVVLLFKKRGIFIPRERARLAPARGIDSRSARVDKSQRRGAQWKEQVE
jgi:hypothetical protein